ncbi:hypothetical protein JCM3770_003231 [Rhodotorula araucariae]
MILRRLAGALVRLPCTCSYASRASPFPSTSASTLDDPLPDWTDLAPAPLRSTKGNGKRNAGAAHPGDASDGQEAPRRSRRPHLPLPPAPQGPPPPQVNRYNLRRPPNERTQVSPFLPLFTRERNFLLTHLRQALSSRSSTRARSFRHSRTSKRTTHRAWNADAVWYALARVLRYPDDVPALPHSHFPSSTRAPPAPSSAHTAQPPASGYFTTAYPDGAGPALQHASDEPLDASGRRKIALTLPELRRAFTVFASARPRTRNGLHRLLVVAELIAQKVPPAPASVEAEDHAPPEGLHELRGGGAGLRDKDWRALLLFVGACMRASRADHEVKHALDLFSHWLKLRKGQQERGRRPRHGARIGRTAAEQQRMYNAVLFVAGRARMWELFEQVLRRMGDESVQPDYATVVEMIRKEDKRGAPAASAWRIFEDALASRPASSAHDGVDALWAAMAWVLARRGMLDDVMRLYEAMQAGAPVALDSLRPTSEDSPLAEALLPSNRPSLVVQPPVLSDRVYTAILKAFAYRGDLAGALRILRDLAETGGAVSPSVHHFVPLFHAFAHHGTAPFSSPTGAYDVNPTTLRGTHLGAHALRRDSSPLAALTNVRGSSRPVVSSGGTAGSSANPFTLDALDAVFASFLSLAAPASAAHSALPFQGARTAPSSKDVWRVLFAFDKLSGGDSELVVAVYDALARKFGDAHAGWTGWRDDKRTPRLVRTHRERVDERRRRWEELQ